jgi:hypothetical protein
VVFLCKIFIPLNKKTFSLIEVIFVLLIISIVITQTKVKKIDRSLYDATNRIKLYLNYMRYIAHIDNKYNINDNEWKKKYWTMKFQKCSAQDDGIYFVIYSDTSGGTAHFKKSECLKDPLTNKYLYSNYDCKASWDESKYVLITKQYNIKDVKISCNSTSTIGQISFDYYGDVYTKLSSNPTKLTQNCTIKLFDKSGNTSTITISPNTGFIY